MGWVLSCLRLKTYYDEVVLYTDKAGYDLLINKLQLPYTNVHVELDCLNDYDKDLWVLAKIHTYSKQQEPFLHVDGDVFIWESFQPSLLEKPIIAQNLEFGSSSHYLPMIKEMKNKLSYLPLEIKENMSQKQKFAYNAGIIGGIDIDFFNNYSIKAKEMIDKNLGPIKYLSNTMLFGTLVEQYLFYCMTKAKNKCVETLLPMVIQDNSYKGFGDFELVPFNKKYLHLIGPFKRDFKTCELLFLRLREEFPEYLNRVLAIFPDKYRNTIELLNKRHNKEIKNLKRKPNRENKIPNSLRYFQRTLIVYKDYHDENYGNLNDSLFDINKLNCLVKETNDERINDLFLFENNVLESIDFFKKYKNNYLFDRDLEINDSFKNLLDKNNELVPLNLIQKNMEIRLFEQNWNWVIEDGNFNEFNKKVESNYGLNSSPNYVLLTPELEEPYYREVSLDQLDYVIIELVTVPIIKTELINQLRPYFINDSDFEENDLKILVDGRIQKLISNKAIKFIKTSNNN